MDIRQLSGYLEHGKLIEIKYLGVSFDELNFDNLYYFFPPKKYLFKFITNDNLVLNFLAICSFFSDMKITGYIDNKNKYKLPMKINYFQEYREGNCCFCSSGYMIINNKLDTFCFENVSKFYLIKHKPKRVTFDI